MAEIIEGPVTVKRTWELIAAASDLLNRKILLDKESDSESKNTTGADLNAAFLHNSLSTIQGGNWHTDENGYNRINDLEFQVVDDVASLPVAGNESLLYFAIAENSLNYWDGAAYQSISLGASATMFVAASDATAKEKAAADYICDGTADEVEILAAQTALGNEGTIYFSTGTFYISSSSSILVNFQGQGIDTSFKPSIEGLSYMFRLNKEGVSFRKFNCFGENGVNYAENILQTSGPLNDWLIDEIYSSNLRSFLFLAAPPTRKATISNSFFYGVSGNTGSVLSAYGSNVNIVNNYADNFEAIIATIASNSDVSGCLIKDNKFINISSRLCFRIAANNIIKDNDIIGTGTKCIASDGTGGENNQIIGNKISGFTSGIQLSDNDNSKVRGNIIIGASNGIQLFSSNSTTVVDNTIISPSITGIYSDSMDGVINDNKISNAPSLKAIDLTGTSGYNQVSNNKTNIGNLTPQITDSGASNNLVNNI